MTCVVAVFCLEQLCGQKRHQSAARLLLDYTNVRESAIIKLSFHCVVFAGGGGGYWVTAGGRSLE